MGNLLNILLGLSAIAQQVTASGAVGGAKDAQHVNLVFQIMEMVLGLHPQASGAMNATVNVPAPVSAVTNAPVPAVQGASIEALARGQF